MLKLIKYLLVLLGAAAVVYSIVWIALLNVICSNLNQNYSKRELDARAVARNIYYVKFNKVSPAGFPYRFGVKVIGWQEESEAGRIECQDPIFIGYDFLHTKFYLNFNGETLGYYNPVQSGFGVKIVNKDYDVLVNYPITYKLLKFLFSRQKEWFAAINFIEDIELKFGKMEIYDLVGTEKIYDHDYDYTTINIEKKKFYISKQDFLDNIPQQINIQNQSKVNEIPPIGKKLFPPNLLYGVKFPLKIDNNTKLYLKTNANTLDELKKDFEIKVLSSKIHNDSMFADSSLLYKVNGYLGNMVMNLQIKSVFGIQPGFISHNLELIDQAVEMVKTNPLYIPLIIKFDQFYSKKDQLRLKELEGRDFNLDINIDMTQIDNKITIKANSCNLFSNKTGINIDGICELDNIYNLNAEYKIKGDILINNYLPLANFVADNLFILYRQFDQSVAQHKFESDVVISFLKLISDHPMAQSDDISFKYDLNSKDVNGGIIGSATVGDLAKLYKISLYKKFIENCAKTENLREKIEELLPGLREDQKIFLEQLILNPCDIEQDKFEEIIN